MTNKVLTGSPEAAVWLPRHGEPACRSAGLPALRRPPGSPPSSGLLWLVVIAAVLLPALTLPAAALAQSRYVNIRYTDPGLLQEFNDNLSLGRNLSRLTRKKNVVTVEDEVYAKVELIVEKVEVALDMFPDNLNFTLVLLPSARAVSAVYKQNYSKSVDHIAYYSLSQKTIYISVDDTRLQVLAHEIGHMVVDHYFKVRPPYNIHELMAQFAEKHVTD